MTATTSSRLEQAMELARRFHGEATDKAGLPYLGHVRRVVDTVTTVDEKVVAALHDLLEDTSLTSADLLAAGCTPRVIAAVDALTHKPGETYDDYLQRAGSDPIARAVKLADIADNADEARLALLEPELAARLRSKYEHARDVLMRDEKPNPEPRGPSREWEFAEVGIPSAEPDTSTTFWCEECGRPAGTVSLSNHSLVVATFLGRMTDIVVDEEVQGVRELLESGDAAPIYDYDPEFAPFWCRRCELVFCGAHWTQETLFDDGFFDEIRGTCPRGHSRRFWD